MVVVGVAAGVVLVPLGLLIGFLDGYGQRDHTRHADAIVVLGARVNEDGSAGTGLRLRTLHAARLFRKGIADHVICTGGVGDNPPSEASVAAKVLRERGVPSAAIVLEDKSTSTWENAANAAGICKKRGWRSVVVASDPFHLWRAEANFRKHGIKAFGSPVAREHWSAQPLITFFWTSREAVLVVRDWFLGRV
jgi:uncharacterized SAM-binding protein YcdF (DUF218 family)